jgi:hypothetical protein
LITRLKLPNPNKLRIFTKPPRTPKVGGVPFHAFGLCNVA